MGVEIHNAPCEPDGACMAISKAIGGRLHDPQDSTEEGLRTA